MTGGSLIPLLTLGIPGNTTSAALMGGLIIKGLIPGPELFTRFAGVTYPFIMSLFVANVVFLLLGLYFAPQLAKVSLIPTSLLIPCGLYVQRDRHLCDPEQSVRTWE